MSAAEGTATLLLLADGRLPTGGHVHSGGVEEAVADGRIRDVGDLGRYLEGRLATTGWVDAALAVAARDLGTVVSETGVSDDWRRLDLEAAARCPNPVLRRVSRTQGRGLLRAARHLWPGLCPPAPAVVLDADVAVADTDAAGAAGAAVLALAGSVHADGPLWPVALGAVARAAEVDRAGTALVAAQASVTGPAWAALRLLGLDPFAVAALLARLAPSVDALAARAGADGAKAGADGAKAGADVARAGADVARAGADVARAGDGRELSVRTGDPGRSSPAELAPLFAALPAASGPLTDVAATAHASRKGRLFAS